MFVGVFGHHPAIDGECLIVAEAGETFPPGFVVTRIGAIAEWYIDAVTYSVPTQMAYATTSPEFNLKLVKNGKPYPIRRVARKNTSDTQTQKSNPTA
jgi:hypothetical protein